MATRRMSSPAGGSRAFKRLMSASDVNVARGDRSKRNLFFGYKGAEGDTYASSNLRMWLVILVWIHAVIITTLMIFEV